MAQTDWWVTGNITADAAELNALDGITASVAELNIVDGVTATAVEINNGVDKSAQIQTLAAAGAITVDGTVRNVKLTGGAYAFTIAAPSAAMLGETLIVEHTGGGTDAKTLLNTTLQGGGAGTTYTFNADAETLILVGGVARWNVVKEIGVTVA